MKGAIQKSKRFQSILMTSKTSSKKNIVEISNQLKQAASNNGLVSLSANQIGYSYSIFVMLQSNFMRPGKFTSYKCKPNNYSVFINPRILDFSVNQVQGWEECASYPNLRFLIKRSSHIIAEFEQTFKDRFPMKEEFKGFEAVVFQHENTHTKCQNLFDIAQDVELVQGHSYSDGIRLKLKQEFAKFKAIRNKSEGKNKANGSLQASKEAEGQKQANTMNLGSEGFNYNMAKSLRDFIEYEIIDPI